MKDNKSFRNNLIVLTIMFGIVRISIFTSYHLVSPFMPEIARNLNTTLIVIGLIISIRSAMGFLGTVWGSVTDLTGPKRGVLIGLTVFGVSMLVIYLFPALGIFAVALPVSYAAILTFDAAMYSYLSDKIPYKNRGKMVAVLESSYALAFMLGSPIAGVLMSRYSWNTPFLFMGLIAAVFIIIIALILPKDRKRERAANGAEPKEKYSAQLLKVVKDKPAILAIVTCTLMMGGNWFAQNMYGAWLEDYYGQSIEQIGFISSAFGLAVFAGAMLCLVFTDKLGKTKAMAVGVTVTIAAGIGAAVFNANSLIIGSVFLFLYFCFIEFATESAIALMTEVREDIRATVVATSFGALAVGSTVGCGLSPIVYEKGYTPCIIIGTVILLAALFIILKVLHPHFSKSGEEERGTGAAS